MPCCGDPDINPTTTAAPFDPPPGSNCCYQVRYVCMCLAGVSTWVLDEDSTGCVANGACPAELIENCSDLEYTYILPDGCVCGDPLPEPPVPFCLPDCCGRAPTRSKTNTTTTSSTTTSSTTSSSTTTSSTTTTTTTSTTSSTTTADPGSRLCADSSGCADCATPTPECPFGVFDDCWSCSGAEVSCAGGPAFCTPTSNAFFAFSGPSPNEVTTVRLCFTFQVTDYANLVSEDRTWFYIRPAGGGPTVASVEVTGNGIYCISTEQPFGFCVDDTGDLVYEVVSGNSGGPYGFSYMPTGSEGVCFQNCYLTNATPCSP